VDSVGPNVKKTDVRHFEKREEEITCQISKRIYSVGFHGERMQRR